MGHRDGTVEHLQGPIEIYLNPKYHDEIAVKDGIQLKENEVILVSHMHYCSDEQEKSKFIDIAKDEQQATLAKKSKQIIQGPTLFVPGADELVEEHVWSFLPAELHVGMDETDPPDRFSKVSLHTNKEWNVKVPIGQSESKRVLAFLTVTYSIVCFEKATLNEDPCRCLCSALMADVQELFQDQEIDEGKCSISASKGFQLIQEKVSKKLKSSSFRHLLGTGDACGFCIASVKLLEVIPGSQLFEQIDQEQRHATKMKAKVADKESQIHFQELELQEEQKRMENKAELARKEAKMKADLAEELHLQKVTALNQENELTKKAMQEKLDSWKAADATVLAFMKNLKDLDVDMSAFLCTVGGQKACSDILRRSRLLVLKPKSELHEHKDA